LTDKTRTENHWGQWHGSKESCSRIRLEEIRRGQRHTIHKRLLMQR